LHTIGQKGESRVLEIGCSFGGGHLIGLRLSGVVIQNRSISFGPRPNLRASD